MLFKQQHKHILYIRRRINIWIKVYIVKKLSIKIMSIFVGTRVNRVPSHLLQISTNVIYMTSETDDKSAEIAIQYNDSYNETLMSFANNIVTPEGGTHEDGFKMSLTRVINNYARKKGMLKDNDPPLSGDDVREGEISAGGCHADHWVSGGSFRESRSVTKKLHEDSFSPPPPGGKALHRGRIFDIIKWVDFLTFSYSLAWR